MTRQIEFAGKSGNMYRYVTLEEERYLPPAGANYVIAQITPVGTRILYAGETERLSAREWESTLVTARAQAGAEPGATEVLTRLNVRAAVRKAEREDLIEQHNPPLNAGAI
ncbi:hypothetical protein [Phenylobacterium aquaticum]|uniref:hypothetical protein n=1 Tax=Phenylobacterium aquaticum TaxID=1763816 RepID=UPI001F5CC312|nr:hypothetical protein [Phenylobacterium aquaticum]MCI3132020.1 hypothetical protein [Phenylobacterium aquaticum]